MFYFNPLSLYRERLFVKVILKYLWEFQSTLPIQGETISNCNCISSDIISIHSPYTGRDVLPIFRYPGAGNFNPLSLYRERRKDCRFLDYFLRISIHSPYTGRDNTAFFISHLVSYFNPLSLYRERLWLEEFLNGAMRFQSTLPIQGETVIQAIAEKLVNYFNPLSLYRERRLWTTYTTRRTGFQSTLPIQGETRPKQRFGRFETQFQSTLPIQGETCGITGEWQLTEHFNPLSLYRERPLLSAYKTKSNLFQSTLPIQGETVPCAGKLQDTGISIHSPYTGRDDIVTGDGTLRASISIHSPYTGRDKIPVPVRIL